MLKEILGLEKHQEPKQKSALEVIADAEYPLIVTQWKGSRVLVKVRELSMIQIRALGNFSLINLGELGGKFDWAQWVAYAEQNYRILRAALVSPTYEQVFELVGKGPMVSDSEARFKELEALIRDMPRGPMRQGCERERDMLRCSFDLLLPDDFVAPIVAYGVSLPGSDIKRIVGEQGREMLLTAATLATLGHNNPADHLQGIFTDFNRDDINRRGWEVYGEWVEQNRKKKVTNGR